MYREDPNRVNEFGSSGAHPEGVPEDADITSEGLFLKDFQKLVSVIEKNLF